MNSAPTQILPALVLLLGVAASSEATATNPPDLPLPRLNRLVDRLRLQPVDQNTSRQLLACGDSLDDICNELVHDRLFTGANSGLRWLRYLPGRGPGLGLDISHLLSTGCTFDRNRYGAGPTITWHCPTYRGPGLRLILKVSMRRLGQVQWFQLWERDDLDGHRL